MSEKKKLLIKVALIIVAILVLFMILSVVAAALKNILLGAMIALICVCIAWVCMKIKKLKDN